MRFDLIAILVLVGITTLGPESNAAPRIAAWDVEVVQKGDHWRHYYRRHRDDWRRYYRLPAPLAPVRPLSCGEFRFWDGERCVDVRFR